MNFKPSDFGGLFSARRIGVVGANGAGKTWLSKRLGPALDLPVTHNDALALKSGWVRRAGGEIEILRDAVAAQTRWIIEGGPSVLAGDVLTWADLIIWLDIPRRIRVSRVLCRSLRFIGQQRPEHPFGNRD